MAETEDSREKRRAYKRQWMRDWRAANPEQAKAIGQAWSIAHRQQKRKSTAKWKAKNPHRVAFDQHKQRAKRQNIPFLLTFTEWMVIWLESGHLGQRGRSSNQYCMARDGDVGPYAIGNVRICQVIENLKAIVVSHDARRRGQLGKKVSAETRQKLSHAAKAQWVSMKSSHHQRRT